MAKTFSAIRHTARQFLRDELKAASTDFAVDELDLHINEVLVEISQKNPYIVKETVTSDGTREIDISEIENLLEIDYAEYPTGNYPPDKRNISIYGTTARLDIDTAPTSGNDVYLWCHKVHSLTESASTLNPALEKVLVEGVVAKAALAYLNQMRSQIVPQTYRWYHDWANNQFLIYQNSLNGITRPRVWEFYPRS